MSRASALRSSFVLGEIARGAHGAPRSKADDPQVVGKASSDQTPHYSMANPAMVGDRLIQVGTNGTLAIVQVGHDWKELTRLSLGDRSGSTPCASGKRLFVRTDRTLWCLRPRNPRPRKECVR